MKDGNDAGISDGQATKMQRNPSERNTDYSCPEELLRESKARGRDLVLK